MSIQNKFTKVSGLNCTNQPDYGKDITNSIWNCKVRYTKDTLEGAKQTHYNIIADMVDVRNEGKVILNNDVAHIFFSDKPVTCVTILEKKIKRTTLECGYDD